MTPGRGLSTVSVSLLAFVLAAASTSAQTSFEFLPRTDVVSGGGASRVAVADLNGDGAPDFALTNFAPATTASVFINKGDGTFFPRVDYQVGGATPYGLALADVNADSKPDMLVTNRDANTMSVLLGNGDGTFRSRIGYATGPAPVAVAVADLNGDGIKDAVTANLLSGGSVTVLLGRGDGTFQPLTSVATGSYSYDVVVGDFNSDGKADIATANYQANTVSVLIGAGNGFFQTAVAYSTPAAPLSIATTDLDKNGTLDLAVGTAGANSVVTFLGTGSGLFQQRAVAATGNSPEFIALGDMNGDGFADAIVPNYGSGTISMLPGLGDGTFGTRTDIASASGPVAVAVADLNHDSAMDAVIGNYNVATASVLLAKSPTATVVENVDVPYSTTSRQVYLKASVVAAAPVDQGAVTFTVPVFGVSVVANVVNGFASAAVTVPGGFGLKAFDINASFSGTSRFRASAGSGTLTIVRASPTISWTTPTAVPYGTPLTAAQLNAVSDVPGVFAYTPDLGAVLAAGVQVLTAIFTPSDPNFASVTVQRQLLVDRAETSTTLVVTSIAAEPGGLGVYRLDARLSGSAPGALEPTGAVSFIADGATIGNATLTPGALSATLLTASLQPGTHALSVVYAGDASYGGSSGSGTVVVKTPGKGAIRSWGYGVSGQLGDGGNGSQAYAGQVKNADGSILSDGIGAAIGGRVGLAIRSDGSVWRWGQNLDGQVGDGTSRTSPAFPVSVVHSDGTPFRDAIALAAGSEHSLALRRDGTVWAWGSNVQGMVGDNTTTSRLNPVQVRLASGPPLDSVVAIAAGESFSIALRSDGTVWTWGFNGDGQLGDGTTTTRLGAVPVVSATGVPLDHVAFIAAGFRHGLAVHSDGTVSGWGTAGLGQLSDGSSSTSSRYTAVRMLKADGTPISDIVQAAGGYGHSMLLTRGGEVWTVGWNYYGQLGTGASFPWIVTAPQRVVTASNQPLGQVVAIGGGSYSSHAVTADGRLWSWGDNTYRQVGDGTATNRPYATPVLDTWTGLPVLNAFALSPKFVSAFALARRGGAALDVASLSFAPQESGTTSSSQALTVSSTGDGDLLIRDVSISGANPADYRIVANGCNGKTLQAGSSCAMQVAFSPGAVGTRTATLSFVSNVEGGITPVSLSGRSYGVPQIAWPAPAPIVYGTALDGTQLNAASNVGGTFTYAPGPDTVLSAGTYTLSATFQPDDPNWIPASATVSLDVFPRKAIVQWTDPAPIVYGTPLSADLFGATADVPGTFAFSPGLGTVLGAGQRSVQIVFTPDDPINYVGRGGSVPVTVLQATPQIGVTGGRVFYDGAQHAATAAAVGGAGETLAPVTITYSGSPIPPTDAGTYVVQAVFPGDANHTSGSASSSLVIDPAVSTLGIAASTGASSTFGESVTFTADISIVQGAATPTGDVTFYADGVVLGAATLNGASASLATSALVVGGHTVTASYSGAANIGGSTTPKLAFSVAPAETTSTLSVNPTPSGLNAAVSLTATIAVTAPGSGVPTGTVEFFDGSLSLGSATLTDAGGIVSGTITTAFSTAGTHTLSAAFSGDAHFNPSTSAPFTHTVNDAAASTSTSLAQSSDTTLVGAAVTLTASVQPQAGKGNPTGTVEFLDGTTVIASAPLVQSGSKFSAAVDIVTLAPGTHTLTARYAGDQIFSGSTSTPLLQTIYQAAAPRSTSTTVTSSPNPSLAGQVVTITAEVKSGGQGAPTGTVAFYIDGVKIGSSNLSTSKSTTLATVAVDTMAAGNHTLTAVYEGDASFAGSGSAQLSQCVGSACVIPNGNGKKK